MSKIDRYKILIRKMIQLGIIASQKDLGRKLGYSNESSFSQIINQKVAEPKDFVERIKSLYPELNTDWLLFGEGDINGTAIVPAEVVEEIREEVAEAASVPILSEDLSTATELDIKAYIEENGDELEKINPSQLLGQADLAEKVMRTSMLPTFAPGDIVFIRFMKDKSKLVDGETYYFDLKSFPTMIRKVKMEGGKLRLIAQNPNFGDIVTDRNDIVSVAKIVGLLRLTFTDFYSDIEETRKQKEEQINNLIDKHTSQVDSLIEQINKAGERENRLIDMLEKFKPIK